MSKRPDFQTKLIQRYLLPLAAGVISLTGCYSNAADPKSGDEKVPSEKKEAVATLAGGCFWCTEAVFERMEGVNDVISGYIGGHVDNPTYEQVCGKRTGHAEACEIYYDPAVVSYEELLELFFKTHDPTTMDQQGADVGPQYRSIVFYHDEEQKQIVEKYIKKLDDAHEFRRPIVTKVQPATKFWPAEEYHQDYFRLNPNAGYCRAVVAKKVRKAKNLLGDKAKDESDLKSEK
jgi:peptide-methionine (S)-S-oxide reductase